MNRRYKSTGIRKSRLIAADTAVFYPDNYDPDSHAPSFALETEPTAIGDVPGHWRLLPRFSTNGTQSRFTMSVDEGTSLYGAGEVTGPLERSKTRVTLWNTDNLCYERYKGRRLYQSHPWVLGVRKDGRAFGILADTTWRCEVSLGKRITLTSDSPGFRVLVMDCDSPQSVMKRLAKLTGTMAMPPMWALGYQQCRWSYYPDKRVRQIADGFRSRQIPCDVIWMDIHYMDGYRVFTFDKQHFPAPKATNNYLHKHGFKGVWMIDPGVKAEKGYAVYDSGCRQDVWVKDKHGDPYIGKVWPGDCVFPDFTRPATRAWWSNLYRPFMARGIDGVWNDMNEPAVFETPEMTMPVDNQHRGGGELPAGPHARYHNVYGMMMVKATRDGVLACQPERRPFILTRSNFLGGHRYAATWTGDNKSSWKHLRMSIPMSISLGLSGQPFNGPDIGGFHGKARANLWGHWMAVGAFFPFSRGHASLGTPAKEPWAFGPTIEQAARVALQRRYRLMPYYYTCFHEANQNGLPVMRPVFFADPKAASLRREDRAFLVGRNLLVIPKWAKDPAIPRGFSTRVSLVGEDTAADPYQCDLRIRDGAIVPLTGIIQTTAEYDHSDLSLLIRLDAKGRASGELYEDANDGFGYRNGEYRLTVFSAEKQGDRLVISRTLQGRFKVPRRQIKLEIWVGKRVVRTTVRDASIMTVEGVGGGKSRKSKVENRNGV